jgi:hypothetical protein
MVRRLLNLAGVIACVFLISPIPLAAQDDTTPPLLTAFAFTPTIDTTVSPATVTVTLTATDDVSGVASFEVWFQSPSHAQQRYTFRNCTPVSTSCTASLDLVFPQYGEAGIWTVLWVITRDVAGNTKWYYAEDVGAMPFPTQLTVISNEDISPPALTAFAFTPTIDTTVSPATVTVTLTATDDVSGVASFEVWFQSPSHAQQRYNFRNCTPVSTSCTASLDLVFPQYSEAGIWTVLWVITRDAAGNTKWYYAEDVGAMGFPTLLLNAPGVVPELVLINAGAVPEAPKGKRSTVSLQALVQNIGTLTASNVRVGFAYSIDGGLTFSNIGASRAGTLAPGAAGIAEYTWKTSPGEYVVRITIDPDNRIAEYDETNNSRLFPVTVR